MLLTFLRNVSHHCSKFTFVARFPNLCARTYSRNFVAMSNIKIGTHDGVFHCDEALACFLLKTLSRYENAEIVRSRNQSILDTCDIVVDVGGTYDHSKLRYDHHMRTFNESLSTVINKPGYDCTIKLSSAGLIYCHYGHEIIKHLAPELGDDDVERVFKRVYNTLIKEIDGIDNGIPMFSEEPKYRIVTCLSSRVDALNPKWNNKGAFNVDEQFQKAVELTGEEFMYFVKSTINSWLPARSIVQECITKRFEVDPSGEIVELKFSLPWSEHLYALEKELNIESQLKFIIFKDNSYRVRAIPVESGSFVCRMFLPEVWGGLRNAELAKVSGIEDAVFVHSIRFIGGAISREGAIKMARKALEIGKNCK